MAHENVRMGSPRAGLPWKVIAIGVAIALVVATVAFLMVPASEQDADRRPGCDTDDDCKPGTSCIARGCLIMLSAESPDLWREDVRDQLDPAVPWQPRSKFGEKLQLADRCPAPAGKGIKPDESRVSRVLKVTVYEVDAEHLRIHQQVKAKGDLWLDALRLWFPTVGELSPKQICVSPEVDSVSIGQGRWRGKSARRVDLLLKRAVPAGTITGAAINIESPLPPASPEGLRTLELGLDPVFESAAAEHTVFAVPLGAYVTTIDGPPPTDQRLLSGYVAYYWEHGKSGSEVAVRFQVPAKTTRRLELTELNP